MGRKPEPWYWEARDGWYVTVHGQRTLLAKGKGNKKSAEKQFHRILGAESVAKPTEAGKTLEWVAYRFLEEVNRTLSPLTEEFYVRHLKPFCDLHGKRAMVEIVPYDVTAWLASTSWGPTTQAGAVTSIKRLFRWAKKQGLIPVNPLVDLEKPRAKVRESILSVDQFRTLLDSAKDAAWQDFLTALWETGCRPREVATVTAIDVDLASGTWTVQNKTRHKGEATRTIYLTPVMVEMTARLVQSRPTGPLFRNMRGRPWTRNAIIYRFVRARKKHGFGGEATAYALRHLYATDALENNVQIATVAELMGHADTKMVARVYSKLKSRSGHLRDAAAKVRPPVDDGKGD